MSTARSRRNGKATECLLLAVTAFAVCGSAHALKSDQQKPIEVSAHYESATLGASGQVNLTGDVTITQGSMVIQGDRAVGHENQDSQWERAIITGSPARFRQQLDDGSMVEGSADTIDYKVSENTVTLTGNATVVQHGRGEFHGAALTYNTDNGQMVGEGGQGGHVHMTFQPKSPPGKAAPPGAPAGAT
jgi:lipopolysaccharide export system protein LptA